MTVKFDPNNENLKWMITESGRCGTSGIKVEIFHRQTFM